MKKGVNIHISFTNRAIYTFIALAVFLVLGVTVFAFGTFSPSTFGHSAGELDLSGGVEGDVVFIGNINITGPEKGIIFPDGTLQTSAGAAGGGVRAFQTVATLPVSVAGGTLLSIGLNQGINPESTSKKVLVTWTGSYQVNGGNDVSPYVVLFRDGVEIYRMHIEYHRMDNAWNQLRGGVFSGSYLDSPATTSATTYEVKGGSATGTVVYINDRGGWGDNQATIVLLEI